MVLTVLTVLMQPERLRHRPGRDFMQMDVPDVPGPTQAVMDSCGDDITGVMADKSVIAFLFRS